MYKDFEHTKANYILDLQIKKKKTSSKGILIRISDRSEAMVHSWGGGLRGWNSESIETNKRY